MLAFSFRVFLSCDSCEIGQDDLVLQFGFGRVAVDRQDIRAEDYVYRFPGLARVRLSKLFHTEKECLVSTHLCLSRALEHFAGFDYAIELITSILLDWRRRVYGQALTWLQALNRLGNGEVRRRSRLGANGGNGLGLRLWCRVGHGALLSSQSE